jgi:hypothetical protein
LKSLESLKEYDLALLQNNQKPLPIRKQQVLDQYIMHGGKTLWLIDQVVAEMDSWPILQEQ